jgi:hypothetical protein
LKNNGPIWTTKAKSENAATKTIKMNNGTPTEVVEYCRLPESIARHGRSV